MQRVFAVRVGNKYGPHYEDYINSKIPNVTWIKKEVVGPRQWNKLYPMSLDIDEPVVVIDIDMMFINDYMDAINYPINRGEFLAAKSWWRDTLNKNYSVQGGFQKYYPKDCKYIYDEFVSKPEYWMEYYPKQNITIPGMGEQYFVEDMARQKLDIKHLPDSWITRWQNQMTQRLVVDLNHHYSADWLHLGEEFHHQVKLVHFLDQEALDEEKLAALANSEPFLT
jgi:hypothetical protein